MKKRIFLSYARDDYAFAHQLLSGLRNVEVEGWMDHTDIAAGAAVGAAIRSAIQKSSAIVVLVSPSSLRSGWVNFEVGAAQALRKPIVPILLKGNDLPETLEGISFLDARDKPIEHVLLELKKAVR
jgi:hypothetical protein